MLTDEALEIRSRSGFDEYIPPPKLFPQKFEVDDEEEIVTLHVKKKQPISTRVKHIGPYDITLKKFKSGNCSIRIYENLPEGKRVVVGKKASLGSEEANIWFARATDTINKVRFEHKTALMRK
jgi:hypothetical protein